MPPKARADRRAEKGDRAEKGEKEAKAAPQGSTSQYTLSGRPYQSALSELFKTTAARPGDIDAKAVQLLDTFQEAGRIEEVCNHLKTGLAEVPREKVQSWNAFIFTILKKFDPEFYAKMREQRGRPRPHSKAQNVPVSSTKLSAAAPEFVPGQTWMGRTTNGATPISLDGATAAATPAPSAEASVSNGPAPEAPAPAPEAPPAPAADALAEGKAEEEKAAA